MFIESEIQKILGCKKIFFPMTHRIKEHVEKAFEKMFVTKSEP